MKKVKKSGKYRAAIIGCGRIGSEFGDNSHAGAYTHFDRTELIAVSDLDEKKLKACQERWHVPSAYQNFEDMLKHERIDILSVCTPNNSHLPIIREAVKYDIKAIYCEKPIAETLEEADEIINLCKASGVLLIINHQRRFNSFFKALRKAIKSGKFGDFQAVTVYYTRGIANSGSHIFDLLLYMVGEVEWVSAHYSKAMSYDESDPNLDGIVSFKNGAKAILQACDHRKYYIFELNLLMEKGRFRIGSDIEYFKVVRSNNPLGLCELIKSDSLPIREKVTPITLLDGVKHIVNCLEGKEKPLSTGEDGRAALELISAFHLSARNNGEKIYLPLKERNIKVKSK